MIQNSKKTTTKIENSPVLCRILLNISFSKPKKPLFCSRINKKNGHKENSNSKYAQF